MMKFAGAVWAALRGKRSTAHHKLNGDITMATAIFQHPPGTRSWFLTMVAKGTVHPCMEIVDLTPDLAQFMLGDNDSNRSIRQTKVTQYSADMANGKWTLNGEPIIISKDGRLNDGQHRCMAVIDSNSTVPVVLMFGIDRETRLTVDQGAARSASDFLGMEGVPNAAGLAAIGRMVIAYERNNGKSLTGSQFVTSAEVRQRAAEDTALAEAASFAGTNVVYSRQFAAGSLIGFAYYVLSRVHHDDAKTFLERVCRGDGVALRSAAHTLREKLKTEGRSRDRKVAMILKAWNFHRRGMKVSPNSLQATTPFPALI